MFLLCFPPSLTDYSIASCSNEMLIDTSCKYCVQYLPSEATQSGSCKCAQQSADVACNGSCYSGMLGSEVTRSVRHLPQTYLNQNFC